jgi:hypothetical protein
MQHVLLQKYKVKAQQFLYFHIKYDEFLLIKLVCPFFSACLHS